MGIIRTIFGAVAFPTAGAGRAFRTDVAVDFTGCFIGKCIIGRALGVSVALNRGVDGCAGFACRTGAGCPTVSAGVRTLIAIGAIVKLYFIGFLCGVTGAAGASRGFIIGRALKQFALFVAGYAVFIVFNAGIAGGALVFILIIGVLAGIGAGVARCIAAIVGNALLSLGISAAGAFLC